MITDRSVPRILLLGPDRADQQWSILDYGEHLQHALASILGRQGDVTLWTPEARGISRWLRRWRLTQGVATYWSRYLNYPRALRGVEAEIYHFLDYGDGWLIRYVDPARTLFTCHDLIPLVLRHQRDSLWPAVSAATYRQSLDGLIKAAAILSDSECTKQDLIRYLNYPAERIHVIPIGLDPKLRPPTGPEESSASRTALGLPEGLLCLHLGHPLFYKNIEGILQAICLLRHRHEPVWLIRAGRKLRPHQRRLARQLGIFDRLVDLGPLPRAQVRQLYQVVDVLVFPSWYEGFGLPPLEAMASGVPVVVSNRGALPETVGAAGLIVDPSRPTEIADAVGRLLHDSVLREDLRALGLARAAQFQWKTTAQQTLAVYLAVRDRYRRR